MTELGSYKAESRRTGLWILLVALGYNLVGSFGVQAADFYVNKTADSNDIFCFPGPPEPPPFNCSLREAIMKANILAGKDTIHVPAGRYTLTQTGRDEDASVTGDLDITDDVEIIGAGALSRLGPFTWIDAAYIDRVFHVHGDVSLDLRGVRIVQGDPGENRDGGGILNVGGRVFVWSSLIRDNRGRTLGGGIEGNGGLVVVADSHIQGNFAEHRGGGIEMRFGSLIVVRSAIDLNWTEGKGGAVSLRSAAASFTNTTIAANTSSEPGAAGGLYNFDSTIVIDSCTFSGNTPYDLARDEFLQGGVRVRNTIVDGPAPCRW